MTTLSQENIKKNWELYEKLPQELKEALLSPSTAESIGNVCEKNEVDLPSDISLLVGEVLLGILPPENFQERIEKELDVEKEKAKQIAEEINRYVFFPVKASLEILYSQKNKKAEEKIIEEIKPEVSEEKNLPKKKVFVPKEIGLQMKTANPIVKERSASSDSYREQID
ncbi:MAG: hypothetical protein PHW72_00515 [Candidatus Pacebacteria bacterium]|nr:hypothetical protein [Candidatus Paceibacterota bacterium]